MAAALNRTIDLTHANRLRVLVLFLLSFAAMC